MGLINSTSKSRDYFTVKCDGFWRHTGGEFIDIRVWFEHITTKFPNSRNISQKCRCLGRALQYVQSSTYPKGKIMQRRLESTPSASLRVLIYQTQKRWDSPAFKQTLNISKKLMITEILMSWFVLGRTLNSNASYHDHQEALSIHSVPVNWLKILCISGFHSW